MNDGPRRERRGRPRRWKAVGNAVFATLRFIGRHVQGFWGGIAAAASIGLAVGFIAAAVFYVLGLVVAGGFTQGFDERVLSWIASHRSYALDRLALELTALGNALTLIVLVAAVTVFLWLTSHRYSAALLALAVLGGSGINSLLKLFYDRDRPTIVEQLTPVISESFPSGHAMSAFVAYSAVAFIVGRLEPTPALRRTTWGGAALVILAIGTSRMYLGVHYPSDIVGGYLAGLAWLAVVVWVFTALKFFARRAPEVEEEEQDLHAEEERQAGVRE